jgi:serine/threonine-protein kinase
MTRPGRMLVGLGVVVGAAILGMMATWLLFPPRIVPRQAEVPTLRGVTTEAAVARLAALGLRGRLSGTLPDPLTPRGTISWQSPASGTLLPDGSVVRLGASTGAPLVIMPDVTDLDLHTAQRVIEAAGLRLGSTETEWSTTPAGIVLRTRPGSRSALRAGNSVLMTISRGPRERNDSTNRP